MKGLWKNKRNQQKTMLPPQKEIERVCQIVNKPGFRRVNIGLMPNATEAEKTKYALCKSIARYLRENNLSEETLAKKLGITQTKLEYILFCHLDKLQVEELINYVDNLTGHLEVRINYERKEAPAEAH
jgi:predicted XRE-type DNA-binding protein